LIGFITNQLERNLPLQSLSSRLTERTV
jgi:hypothetical protein